MAIHDTGFRGFTGQRTSVFDRCMALWATELRRFLKSRRFLAFYVFCIFPAVIALVVVYIRFGVFEGQGSIGGMGVQRGARFNQLFGNSMDTVGFYLRPMIQDYRSITILFSAVVGSAIISRDRQEGALELYFTRGIRPVHYFLAKWSVALTLILGQTLFPYLLVWVAAVFLAPDWAYFETTVGFIPHLIAAQLVFGLSLSLFAAAQSATTTSPRFAVMRWVGALFLLIIIANILYLQLRKEIWLMVSPWHVLQRIAEGIGGATPEHNLPLTGTVLIWAGLCLASIAAVRRYLQPVEVVG